MITSIRLGGISTGLHEWGDPNAPTVIVAHSVGLDGSSASGFAHALLATDAGAVAPRWRVLAPDLRGHGDSGAEPDDISLGAMARDLIELARDCPQPPRLLGTSLGGCVAALAAAEAPEAFRDLTVVCSPDHGYAAFVDRAEAAERDGMSGVVEATLERWFTGEQRGEGAAERAAVGTSRRSLQAMRVEIWAATWREFALFDRLPDVGRRLVTTAIAGELDSSTPPSVMQSAATALGAELFIVPGAPHQLLLTHPEALASLWATRTSLSEV